MAYASTPLVASIDPKDLEKQYQQIATGGFQITPDLLRRAGDVNYGMMVGQREFYEDPDMQRLRQLRENMAKGYEGSELGAIRQQARGELAGKQAAEMRNLQSRQARQGVGGARAAAMQGQLGRQFTGGTAEAERKMALDQGQMKRQGSNELQDFLFRQKYGKMGTAAGMAQMASSDYAAQQQAVNEMNKGQSGPCCFIFLEARYGNGTMDEVVRKFRDEHMTDRNKRGYYKLSEVLVPVMRKSKLAKGLVRLLMTDPLVAYGKAYYGKGSKLGKIFAPVKNFWLKAFDYLGQDHEFIRENGEVI